jgi:hypothetical protein
MKKLVVCLALSATLVMSGTAGEAASKRGKQKTSVSQETLQEQSARIDALKPS